jgi:predicted glycogen debranching enzyme
LDDCFQTGFFELQVPPHIQKEFAVTATVYEETLVAKEDIVSIGSSISEINASYSKAIAEKKALLSEFYSSNIQTPMNDWLNWILMATDSFIVQSLLKRKGVIAGYHWFESWGRDTFISLPGLMLITSRFNDAKNILQNYIQHCKNGLIPNYLDDKTGNPVYNTVDATLWYVNAVYQYLQYTRDFKFIKTNLWKPLRSIIENHQKGTLFGISMNQNGLLSHGAGLTWMDAKVGTTEITPRKGMAVEIQALWYNTLRIMQLLAGKFGEVELAQEYALMADESRRSFNDRFWDSKKECLFDVVDNDVIDTSLRPNQIFAVSLDFSMLDKVKGFKVVESVTRELATSYGLRTLSSDDPKFIGKYEGDRRARDIAYHNGAIWPWLLGPYITAYLKVYDYTFDARNFAFQNHILPLFNIGLKNGGLGTINEIYDSDPPNKPRGCISQAWSIAEPLRAYVEDVLKNKPKTPEKLFTFEN